jgi:Spy/CpxP family protein refolding chaperone
MKRSMIFYFAPVLLLAFYAYGVQRGKYKGSWHWWKDTSIVDQLKLSDEQTAKIEKISLSYEEQLNELGSRVIEKRRAFKETMGNPNSTKEAIIKAFDDSWDANYKMKKVQLEMRLDITGVLTPDQITKLSEIKGQRKKK